MRQRQRRRALARPTHRNPGRMTNPNRSVCERLRGPQRRYFRLTFHIAAVIVKYDMIIFRKIRMYTIVNPHKPLFFLILSMLHVATSAGIRTMPIQITLTKIAKFIFLYLCNADASKSTCTGSRSNNIDKNIDRPASGWRGSLDMVLAKPFRSFKILPLSQNLPHRKRRGCPTIKKRS